MDFETVAARLQQKGVKPTTNRILVFKELAANHQPMSLSALEARMPNMDKSSIFRVLTVLLENEIVHAFEDGRGLLNYELCLSHGACSHNDSHIHFYCESCQKSFCLEDIHIPHFTLPEGFCTHSMSFVIKGECPDCRRKNHHI